DAASIRRWGFARTAVGTIADLTVTYWIGGFKSASRFPFDRHAIECDYATVTKGEPGMRIEPVFLFDLDGTLVDSVYQHVLAWKHALDAEGIELCVWRSDRNIGMSA